MTLFYYLLLCVAHVISLPILCIMACRQKYKDSIPLRFFFPKNRSKEHYDIWLHACSVGEVQSLQTIIESIPKTQTLLLTIITQTGYTQAQKLYSKHKNLTIGYLPFETFLPLYSPTCKKLFVFEAELWLMLFVCAKKRGAETRLINARISTRSVSRYQKLSIFYRHFFCFVDSVLSQSDEDTSRLILLGAKNVQTLGNIKLLNPIIPKIAYKKPESLILVAASTHSNEELLILEAWKKVKSLWQNNNHVKNLDSKSTSESSSKDSCFVPDSNSTSCNSSHNKESILESITDISAFTNHEYSKISESNLLQNLDSKSIHNPHNNISTEAVESNMPFNNYSLNKSDYNYKAHHYNPSYNNRQDICIKDSICIKQDNTICKDFSNSLLIIVPRHPERFNAVYELCKKYGKTLRLSELRYDETLDIDQLDADILLIDSMGMLINFYAISDIVILGGAFAKIGGHNPLEPANFHNIVISGMEIFNQRALFEYVSNYYLVDSVESLSMLLYNYKQLEIASINKDLCIDMIRKILS